MYRVRDTQVDDERTSIFFPDTVPGKQLGLRGRERERERDRKKGQREISDSREKTDRAERALAINLGALLLLAVYNHGALKS